MRLLRRARSGRGRLTNAALKTDEVRTAPNLGRLETTLRTEFADRAVIVMSLTHRSYAFEQGGQNNERLEFLGDAVLGLIVTDLIYAWYPDLPEGDMAKLRASVVNMPVLAEIARSIKLGEELLLGKGEEMSGGREKSSILADALEAVIGAVYLDGGLDSAQRLIEELFSDHIREHVESGEVRDFKTSLQELAVADSGAVPSYRLTATGPDHAKRFKALVYIDGQMQGEGEGRSKKSAEQAAAREAMSNWSRTDA